MPKLAILCGSVYGTAEEVARHAEEWLQHADIDAHFLKKADVATLLEFAPDAVLAVTSTTGMGEMPDDLQQLLDALTTAQPEQLRGKPVAVIGLGDSSYGEQFCAGALQAHMQLLALGMRDVVRQLQLDASETVTHCEDAEPWLARLAVALQG